MKMTCPQSIKFLKLKRRLRLPHWQTVGLLESLWLFTQQNAPRGDIGRFPNEDIAAGIEWDGDADLLVAEFVACGFVDECEDNRLVVHDWVDHMPTYLKGAMAKNGLQVAKHAAKQPAKHDQEQAAKHGAKQTQNIPEQPAPSLVLSGPTLPNQTNPENDAVASVVLSSAKRVKFNPSDCEIPESINTQAFRDAWRVWVDHRREIRKPLTPTAAEQCLAKCVEMGEARSIAAIQHSAGNGWQGLFEPINGRKPKHDPTEQCF